MHILAILGTVLAVLFRMQQAANAARDLADAADEARGFFRRWGWRRKHLKHPLDAVDDAREAATVMMVAAAQSDGNITERERLAIVAEVTRRFGATPSQAEELTPLILRTCGPTERSDLVEMLGTVAAADGPSDEVVTQDIALLAHKLR